MEYLVGSLADLISGNNTPNKPTVIKKQFANPNKNRDSSVNSAQLPVTQDNNQWPDLTTTKKYRKNFKNNTLPIKRNKLISDRKDQQDNITFKKKNKHNRVENTNRSNLMVIDHTQVDQKKKHFNDDSEGTGRENVEKSCDINQEEVSSRTIFVGNVATTVKKRQLLRFFGKYGKIQSARLRCVTPANPGVSKRVAVIKNMLHPKRTTLHSYITFEKREDAIKATELNGKKYKEHYLRIQLCDDVTKPDSSKAIFIGNLPFDVEDDDLWKVFESCGPITSVRVVRNSFTGMGIGIGYVNFDFSDSVELALQMEDVTIKSKEIRIQRCHKKKSCKEKQAQDGQTFKRHKNNLGDSENEKLKHKKKKTNQGFDKSGSLNIENSVFQGSKSNRKKQRPKLNKGLVQKMKLSQKIAPRST